MKKILILLSLLLMTTTVYADELPVDLVSDVNILLNHEDPKFETPPYILNGRTIVPIKFIMDTLGYEVTWEGETQTVYARRGDHYIKLIIGDAIIHVDDVEYESDVVPLIIGDRTYVPLALIARATGAEVNWIAETRTVTIEEKLEQLNVFYGPSSYKNFQGYDLRNSRVDSISYAWSSIDIFEGMVQLNTSSINDNSMFVPKDYDLVMTDKPSYLNVYNDHDYELVFSQSDGLIDQIKQALQSPLPDQPIFQGVVIDFEAIPEEYYLQYYAFLEDLNGVLNDDIKIIVAVQPRKFDFKVMLSQVDKMILMLHDYESKTPTLINFNDEFVYQPVAPITKVEEALILITESLSVHEKSKLLLQLNLSAVQWQGESLYQVTRYTPGYQKLILRMETLEASNFQYDDLVKSPYVHYMDENDMINTIWYENEVSLQAKIDLVKQYDLGGVSLWQIGNLPQNYGVKLYELNLIEQIFKNY